MSRLASTSVSQASGLNQCAHTAATNSSFAATSNRRIWASSWASTQRARSSSDQSNELGTTMAGRTIPRASGATTSDDATTRRRRNLRRWSVSHAETNGFSTGAQSCNLPRARRYTARNPAAHKAAPDAHTQPATTQPDRDASPGRAAEADAGASGAAPPEAAGSVDAASALDARAPPCTASSATATVPALPPDSEDRDASAPVGVATASDEGARPLSSDSSPAVGNRSATPSASPPTPTSTAAGTTDSTRPSGSAL